MSCRTINIVLKRTSSIHKQYIIIIGFVGLRATLITIWQRFNYEREKNPCIRSITSVNSGGISWNWNFVACILIKLFYDSLLEPYTLYSWCGAIYGERSHRTWRRNANLMKTNDKAESREHTDRKCTQLISSSSHRLPWFTTDYTMNTFSHLVCALPLLFVVCSVACANGTWTITTSIITSTSTTTTLNACERAFDTVNYNLSSAFKCSVFEWEEEKSVTEPTTQRTQCIERKSECRNWIEKGSANMLNLFIVLSFSFVTFRSTKSIRISQEQQQDDDVDDNQLENKRITSTHMYPVPSLCCTSFSQRQTNSQEPERVTAFAKVHFESPAIARWNQLINEACKTPKKECQQRTEWVLGWNRTYTQWNNGIRRLPVSNLWFRFASLSLICGVMLIARNTRNQPHGAICKPSPGPNKKDTTEMCQCDISTANKCHSLHFVDCMRTA